MSCRYAICACEECVQVWAVIDAARAWVECPCMAHRIATSNAVRALDGGDQ